MKHSGLLESIDRLGLMGWDVLVVGWDRGWVTREDVSRYALDRLLPKPSVRTT